MVGIGGPRFGPQHALRWVGGAAPQDLGTLPGSEQSFAEAVSSDGAFVAGYSHVEYTEPVEGGGTATGTHKRAFVWSAAGGLRALNWLQVFGPGGKYAQATPTGVSTDGRIASGTGRTTNLAGCPYEFGCDVAVRWVDGAAESLGVLGAGGDGNPVPPQPRQRHVGRRSRDRRGEHRTCGGRQNARLPVGGRRHAKSRNTPWRRARQSGRGRLGRRNDSRGALRRWCRGPDLRLDGRGGDARPPDAAGAPGRRPRRLGPRLPHGRLGGRPDRRRAGDESRRPARGLARRARPTDRHRGDDGGRQGERSGQRSHRPL